MTKVFNFVDPARGAVDTAGQGINDGESSMAAWEFQMAQNMAEKHNWYKFISMQGLYNLPTENRSAK
ncbi:uncharacterized protein EAF01_011677 [Botrytis porri]|uniref:uncharacterized protein n=1 Tax=Botrytis porri TaxID=87229 RepID=UPI001901BE3C|nr:uncharacterized protein EAF01_011677 [Botrytis porri]KAF7883168.1 hypothetical protein EAF01_011677 [Botrytis porri]